MNESNGLMRPLTLLERRESNIAMNHEFLKSLALSKPEFEINFKKTTQNENIVSSTMSSNIIEHNLSAVYDEFSLRKQELCKIIEYLDSSSSCRPMIVCGEHGQGKSSICQAATSVFRNVVVVTVNCVMFDNRREFLDSLVEQVKDIARKYQSNQSSGDILSAKAHIDVYDVMKSIVLVSQSLPRDRFLVLFFDDIDCLEALQKAIVPKLFGLTAVIV